MLIYIKNHMPYLFVITGELVPDHLLGGLMTLIS